MKNKELVIYGETGKGGSSTGHTPIEAIDTLASRQRVKLLFAVSEGEIQGIDQVYLNQVPISNYNATFNWRPGTLDQTVITGFTNIETPLNTFSVVNMLKGSSYFAAIPYDVASTRLTFTLPALREVLPDGDMVGYSVSHSIYYRPNTAAGWTLAKNTIKTGKTSSTYTWEVDLDRPVGVTSASNWEIMLQRNTPNDMDAQHNSAATWDSVILIYQSQHTYPGTALVGITFNDAAQFGGNIPEILFRIKGKKVKIPSNYDPVAHTYTETPPWDGSLTENIFYYTANPAWHIYTILNTPKLNGGLGIDKTDIDIISLYQLSKYADGLVDNGYGGLERRYELHNQFITRENVPTFLMYLLNICNANFTSNEFGQISIMFDHSGQAVTKQVTNANVVDGLFSYSSNDLESRYSIANVTYNSNNNYGKTDTSTEVDNDLITRYGVQTTDVVLPGCTSEGQAKRKARWAIFNNAKLTGLVTYRLLFGGLVYHIGELVRLYDNDNQGNVQAGVIRSYAQGVSTTVFTLDRPIILNNEVYTLYFKGSDEATTEIVKTISESNGTFTTVTVQGIVASAPNAIFTLSGSVQPRLVKVVKIDKSDELYTITCVDHSELKYSYIETGISVNIPTGDFVNVSEFTTVVVANIAVDQNFSGNGVISKSQLQVKWAWPSSGTPKYSANYKLSWKRDNQQAQFISDIPAKGYDIDNPVPGVYEITVWAVNPFTGISSAPIVYVYNFRTVSSISSLLPPDSIFVTGTNGLTYNTTDLSVSFSYPVANTYKSDTLLDYVVEVWDITTTNKKGTFIVSPDANRGGLFVLSFVTNNSLFGIPTRQYNLKIFSRDTIGDLSNAVLVTVNNPVPTLTNWIATASFDAIYIHITPSTELDIKEYLIYGSTVTGFTKNDSTLLYAGADVYNNFKVLAGTTMYYAISIADSFGRAGSLISTEQSTTSLSGDPDTFTYTGLNFHPNNPIVNKVTWDAATATRITALGVTTTWNIISNPIGTLWTSGIMYIYYVPGDVTLSTETNLVTIIAAGGRILATYKGGADCTADAGRAFISGDQILAGTVGANNLIANTAVITNAAQIGNVLESSNYTYIPGGSATGWRIDKTGWAQYSQVTITNTAGHILFDSGATHQITGGNVTTWIDTAAIGAAQIGSISLVGNYNFKSASAGARIELDANSMRVYDVNNILRVKLGNLSI
jgi:predicted phage tail protein